MATLRRTLIPVVMCHVILMTESNDQHNSPRTERLGWDGWSNWGTWSRCSQRCGDGLAARTRRCLTSHSSSNHIGNCQGSYKQYKICKGKDCEEGRTDYRTEQCAKYNHKVYSGKTYKWVPFVNPHNQCELSCRADGHQFFAKFAPMVPDGTHCNIGLYEGACVSGKCKRVGCDGVIGSSALKDQCGICKGDNSTCRIISGIFMRPRLRYGYSTISKIPAGSCNINITETKPSRNFLALKKSGGEYIFNGNWRQSPGGRYEAVGARFTYSRSPNRHCPGQCIFASGPTNRTIDLQLLAYNRNPGIRYTFTVPLDMVDKVMSDMLSSSKTTTSTARTSHSRQSETHRHRHHNNRASRGGNHANRGGNHRNRSPTQTPRIKQLAAPQRLEANPAAHRSPSFGAQALRVSGSSSNPTRPKTGRSRQLYPSSYRNRFTSQNTHSRPYPRANQWRDIARDRLTGRTRYNTRPNTHLGTHQQPSALPQSSANVQSVPSGRRLQYGQQPRYIPPYEPQQSRSSYRYDNGGLSPRRYNPPTYISPESRGRQALDSNANNPSFPAKTSLSNSNRVSSTVLSGRGQSFTDKLVPDSGDARVEYSWRIAGFTECSTSCGGGTQKTNVVCMKGKSEVVVTDDNCDPASRPLASVIACNNQPCPPAWFADEWGLCSATCGKGTQSRLVECRKVISAGISVSVSADLCADQPRPVSYGECNFKPCTSWLIGNWTKCSTDCGLGQRSRSVTCVGTAGERLPSSHCQDAKPPTEEVCDMGSCAKDWFYTRWSKQCSSDCGEGHHTRKVYCSADDGSNLPESKCPTHKPRTKKHCKHKKPCGGHWFAGPWSGCSASCGIAMRRRDVVCMKRLSASLMSPVGEENCRKEDRPVSEEQCGDLGPCPPEWFITEWGECSASCGTGVRTRELKCLYPSLKPSQDCEKRTKPSTRQSCNKHSCYRRPTETIPGCKDKYASFCVMVVQARLCSYKFYKERCCLSCRNHS